MRNLRVFEIAIVFRRKRLHPLGAIFHGVMTLLLVVFVTGCTKDYIDKSAEYLSSNGVDLVFPAKDAENVEVNPVIGVTFSPGTDPSTVSASLNLSDGTMDVAGTVYFTESAVAFSYDGELKPSTLYTATLTTEKKNSSGSGKPFVFAWSFITGNDHKDNSLSVVSVDPPNSAGNVPVNTFVTVTLDKEIKEWMKGLISVKLQDGSAKVKGKLAFSENTVKFDPVTDLAAGTRYSAGFSFGPNEWVGSNNYDNNHSHDSDSDDDDDGDNDKPSGIYKWRFTTAGTDSGTATDVIPPVVIGAAPATNSGSVPVNISLAVTFSEDMNSSTITNSTFYLKQGSTDVSGMVTYSGKVATFTPSAVLKPGAVYTATVTNGVKDLAGNVLASNYTWTFTTATAADVTPPVVASVVPANNATAVATNARITITFSEAVNPSTVTSSSVTLNQGSSSISGNISSAGNVATFTPAAVLAGGTVYTLTITTAVTDLSGNAMVTPFISTFTTSSAPAAGLSFASDVVPVLDKCNACHTHKWVTSTSASAFYTNLVNAGYVKPSSPTTSLIYTQLNSGHASSIPLSERQKILTWMTEGSKNN